jgi:hypothetical protein
MITETSTETTSTPVAPLLRLARITHGDSGRCGCCKRAAAVWYRTGLIVDARLTVAARYCEEHDPDSGGTGQRLGSLTLADVARLSPRRARRARQRAEQFAACAAAHGRASAALAGASSATHAHALLAGAAAEEADAYRRLAEIGKDR